MDSTTRSAEKSAVDSALVAAPVPETAPDATLSREELTRRSGEYLDLAMSTTALSKEDRERIHKHTLANFDDYVDRRN